MTWKNLMLVSFLGLAPAIVGCGYDCEDLCEDSNDKCEGEDTPNCEDTCKDIEALNEKAGCEDSYDELLDCADDSDNICEENQCKSEVAAYSSCMTKYCTAHASACIVG